MMPKRRRVTSFLIFLLLLLLLLSFIVLIVAFVIVNIMVGSALSSSKSPMSYVHLQSLGRARAFCFVIV